MTNYLIKSKMQVRGEGTEEAHLFSLRGELTASQVGIVDGDIVTYKILSNFGEELGVGQYHEVGSSIYIDRWAEKRINLINRPLVIYFLEETSPDNLFEVVRGNNEVVVYLESNGNMRFSGDAKYWDDIRTPVNSFSRGGVKDPGFAVFKTTGSGSTGVFIYWFDSTLQEEVFFGVQFPHSWDLTPIYPHIHWVPKADSSEVPANQFVRWGLEYTWSKVGGLFSDTEIIYANSSQVPLIGDSHYIAGFGALTPSSDQAGLSSMLLGRLFRDATNDTYGADAGLIEFDIHFQADSLGSDEPLEK